MHMRTLLLAAAALMLAACGNRETATGEGC
ncbi:MAG: lipoprotein, partial [Hyphomonadaceae bacterium]|nr:lipoprotein [Hyphomonadaceae bacterium]